MQQVAHLRRVGRVDVYFEEVYVAEACTVCTFARVGFGPQRRGPSITRARTVKRKRNRSHLPRLPYINEEPPECPQRVSRPCYRPGRVLMRDV